MSIKEYEEFYINRYGNKPTSKFLEKLIEKGYVKKNTVRTIEVVDVETKEILYRGAENDYRRD